MLRVDAGGNAFQCCNGEFENVERVWCGTGWMRYFPGIKMMIKYWQKFAMWCQVPVSRLCELLETVKRASYCSSLQGLHRQQDPMFISALVNEYTGRHH